MSETTPESTPSSNDNKKSCSHSEGHCARHGKRRGIRRFLFGALVLGLLAIPAAKALAGGWSGCHGGLSSSDPAVIEEHLGKGADRLMDRVDGTQEQRAAVQALSSRYAPEIAELHVEKQALAERTRELLGAPTVDRASLEGIRQEALTHIGEASALAVDATVELSGILTQEQRQELLKTWDHFRE